MSTPLFSGKRVLLVVSGGIAAYKALELIRRLRDGGAAVQVVMTETAKAFVSELTAATLSGAPVRSELLNLSDESAIGHIELSRAADLVVVAPATANLLAEMAHGLAGDLASTLLLATDKRVLVAPAMNVRMWLHPATRRNVAQLKADGVKFVGPNDGSMACGEYGPGRMAEPAEIVAAIGEALRVETFLPLPDVASKGPLSGRKVVVTAGPTFEPIDPVRFIGNRSSGLQGYAIAEAARRAGAEVTLISGPVTLADIPGVRMTRVETARQMLDAVASALPADVFVSAAAVADWRVEAQGDQKLKKTSAEPPTLRLVENPDILASIASSPGRPALVVGFAAETENVLINAQKKLAKKKCDFIVANDVSPNRGVFGGSENEVMLVTSTGVHSWPRMTKTEVAENLIAKIVEKLV